MTWLTWRQHRATMAAFLVVFGGLAIFLLIDGIALRHDFDAAGLTRCVGVVNDPDCAARRQDFLNLDVGAVRYVGWLIALAAGALGAFLGSPMVSSEFEHGTYQWVWTQGVSRTRWLTVKLALPALAAIGLSFGTALAYGWWNTPIAALTGPFTPMGSFDTTPLMLCAYTLFAFALGVLVSGVIRRTVAAIGLTLLAFVGVRIGILALRRYYQAPTAVTSVVGDEGAIGLDPRDWDIDTRYVDASGTTVSKAAVQQLFNPALNPAAAGSSWSRVLAAHGVRYEDLVQPFTRAGDFQLIEAGLYLVLIVLCVAAAFWRIGRRA
jgi:ABC-type transport system involved in multi-copper enzyme maturation permease subunit